MKAVWNNTVLAESTETVVIEGNHYFPPESINKDHFKNSELNTSCPWKGIASYYHIEVGGEVNEDAAWYYPEVSSLASSIKGYVAFWNGVEVIE